MVKPIGNRLLVEPIEADTKKQGLLYVPDTASGVFKKGKVVAVGSGHYEQGSLIPVEAKVGDVVFFIDHAVAEISQDGKKLSIVPETSVIAIDE